MTTFTTTATIHSNFFSTARQTRRHDIFTSRYLGTMINRLCDGLMYHQRRNEANLTTTPITITVSSHSPRMAFYKGGYSYRNTLPLSTLTRSALFFDALYALPAGSDMEAFARTWEEAKNA